MSVIHYHNQKLKLSFSCLEVGLDCDTGLEKYWNKQPDADVIVANKLMFVVVVDVLCFSYNFSCWKFIGIEMMWLMLW